MSSRPAVTSPPEGEHRSEVHWMSPAAGRWAASRRGEPVGTIERVDGSYRVSDGRGRSLGAFDDLDSARGVIDRRSEHRSRSTGGVTVVTALLWGVIGGAVTVALVLVIVLVAVGG